MRPCPRCHGQPTVEPGASHMTAWVTCPRCYDPDPEGRNQLGTCIDLYRETAEQAWADLCDEIEDA